jgi:hypothetical protein
MPEEALRQYDELEGVYLELATPSGAIDGMEDRAMLEDRVPHQRGVYRPVQPLLASTSPGSASAASPLSAAVRHSLEVLPAPHVLDVSGKPYRDMINQNSVSVFDFRHYLFARQCQLLLQLGRLKTVVDRAQGFFRSIAGLGDRQVRAALVSQQVLDEWLYTSVMDVVEVCQRPLHNGNGGGMMMMGGPEDDEHDGEMMDSGTAFGAMPSRADAVKHSRALGEMIVFARQRLGRLLASAFAAPGGAAEPSDVPDRASHGRSRAQSGVPERPHSASALGFRRALASKVCVCGMHLLYHRRDHRVK